MELLLCGGGRPSAPGNFHNYRNILGSAELPAQMQYLVRARRTEAGKERIFGENHRIARRENVPAFLWFERTEDDDALNGVGGVYMPFNSTYDVSLYVPEERGRRGPGIPSALREWIEGKRYIDFSCALWWLDEVTPLESDAPTLLAFAREAFGADGDEYSRTAAARALGRVHDAASERLLREVDAEPATASLARRGLPDAMRDLLEDDDLARLLEAAPGFAVARLRERLLDPESVDATCNLLVEELDETYFGIRFDETLFAGIAEAAIASDVDSHALARIAVTVPGCRRKALAEAAFARLEPASWLGDRDPDFEAAAFLYAADAQRLVAALRGWTEHQDEEVRALALAMLLHIGDPESAEKLVGTVDHWIESDLLARTHAPAVEHALIENEGSDQWRGALFAYTGLRWLHPDGAAATLAAAKNGEAIPAMLRELDAAEERKIYPEELGLLKDPRVVDWLRKERSARTYQLSDVLSALVLAGDEDAREELWSMIRCGRHRLLYSSFDERVFTLDWDLSTLPHWIEELDSNCCRVAGGLESIFEDRLGMRWLYNRPWSGNFGEPRSRRVRTEFLWSGGRYVWSPLVDGFVAAPD
jgi:3-methyladenine DNA glycosylase AlkC